VAVGYIKFLGQIVQVPGDLAYWYGAAVCRPNIITGILRIVVYLNS